MKQLTEQQITNNWTDLRTIVNNTFSGERLEKLNKMYDFFEDRMIVAPASGKEHFHNAMVGGYVEHILHIVKFSQELRDMWEKNGATINFTNEELVFAALHHDLGKVGNLEHDYYLPQENDWFVTCHVREPFYKDRDDYRDSDISSFFLAFKEIVANGGWVIRMGDKSMSPIPKMNNVIDYATSEHKSDWMDIFLCAYMQIYNQSK